MMMAIRDSDLYAATNVKPTMRLLSVSLPRFPPISAEQVW